jgi:predicted MPP superfamily phosphohydrolase
MEFKLLVMGKIIFAIIFFCFFSAAKGQKNDQIMVVINPKDSVEYIQKNKTKFLKFYFLDNVKYNSTQKKQILSGGHILCETCKKESYSVSVIPIKKPSSKLKKVRVSDFLFKNHGYADLFFLKDKYYKYNGRLID